MRQHVDETHEVSRLELLPSASRHDDREVWAAFQQSLEETVLTWLHDHPGREAACRIHSERHFITQAFEQLRLAIVQGQVACETLCEEVVYLRASLNGAIMETLRASSRPKEVALPLPEEFSGEDQTNRSEQWEIVQTLLPHARERRLAYLLYCCGLEPAEIVRLCPQEWSDVQEISRLRRTLLQRLHTHAHLLDSWLTD